MKNDGRILLIQTFDLKLPTRQTITQSIKINNGKLLLTGRLQYANKPNGNGRIYPKQVLQKQIKLYQQKIRLRKSVGQCDHPDSDSISLKNVAIMVTQVHWQGDEVVGTIQLLSNSIGKDMQALIEDGVSLSISSRGMGSLTHKDGYDYVQSDYELVCWDLVHQPSTQGATFYTGTIGQKLETIIRDKTPQIVTNISNISSYISNIYQTIQRNK